MPRLLSLLIFNLFFGILWSGAGLAGDIRWDRETVGRTAAKGKGGDRLYEYRQPVSSFPILRSHLAPRTYGCLTVVPLRVTAVCESSLPLMDAAFPIVIAVLPRMIPLNSVFAPMVTAPATCQKMFFA